MREEPGGPREEEGLTPVCRQGAHIWSAEAAIAVVIENAGHGLGVLGGAPINFLGICRNRKGYF